MIGSIYKPGQGYWTRLMSAIALALLTVMGVIWLWKNLERVRIFDMEPIIGQAVSAVIIITVMGVLAYWLLGVKPRVVDFMIATEGEMKKVNWTNRQELMGSTAVVIGFIVFLSLVTFSCDFAFGVLFRWAGVLETTT